MVEALLYLSQLSDLFRQASNLRVGDTARVLMGHVVHQRVHLSGQVPSKEHETHALYQTTMHFHLLQQIYRLRGVTVHNIHGLLHAVCLKSLLDMFIYKCEQLKKGS